METAFRLQILPGKGWLEPLAARFEAAIMTRFDRISTISEEMIIHAFEKSVPMERTYLLLNWVDTKKIFPIKNENPLRMELKISGKNIVVLYHGNLGRKQGLEILIDAARLLQKNRNIQFILSGDGNARSYIVKLATGLDNVRFIGLQPVERLNLLVNLADIHVLPQQAEAVGLVMPSKLTNMFASGKPVIATADLRSELGRVVDQVGILVPPGDPDALSKAILKLASDPVKRKKLGALGRNYAIQKWDYMYILDGFREVMDQLVV